MLCVYEYPDVLRGGKGEYVWLIAIVEVTGIEDTCYQSVAQSVVTIQLCNNMHAWNASTGFSIKLHQ